MNPNAGRPDLRDLISPSENSRHCKAVLSQYHDERFPRVPPEMLMGVQALYEQEPKARLRWWETIPITAKVRSRYLLFQNGYVVVLYFSVPV